MQARSKFEAAQVTWLQSVVNRAEKSAKIQTLVVGMHAALPGSLGDSHSMSNWAQGNVTGRQVYEALWHAQSVAHKKVYILASHSHFYMEDVFAPRPGRARCCRVGSWAPRAPCATACRPAL